MVVPLLHGIWCVAYLYHRYTWKMLLGPIGIGLFGGTNSIDLYVLSVTIRCSRVWNNWCSLFDGTSTIFCSYVASHVTVVCPCVPARVLVPVIVTVPFCVCCVRCTRSRMQCFPALLHKGLRTIECFVSYVWTIVRTCRSGRLEMSQACALLNVSFNICYYLELSVHCKELPFVLLFM